ncbi:DNA repair protein RecN [Gangjinia marincola]|uniref:DNA repair protein RecN n=1 Tax=Gangjinia marincola TaxID=578463 RepID=A0ABN1MEY4_9FLAO
MLTSLDIQNFALIEDIHIDLADGFTILTGETGAGKSILLGALALLLGKRADLSTVKNQAQKCIIEANVDITAYKLQKLFEVEDIDYEDLTIIRREILPSGKSRAFINDTPVRLDTLALLGKELIDIHSQHDTLLIGNTAYQYKLIDSLAENESHLDAYRIQFEHLKTLEKELEDLQIAQAEASKTHDYNAFLVQELNEIDLIPGAQEEQEEIQHGLSNVELIKEQLGQSYEAIINEDVGIEQALQEIKRNLQYIASFSSEYQQLLDRIESLKVEVQDVAQEMDQLNDKISDDPQELIRVNDFLEQLYALQKKHQVDSIEGLLRVREKLEYKVSITTNAEEEVAAKASEIQKAKEEVVKLADTLYQRRQHVMADFIASAEAEIARMGMPHARLNIELAKTDSLNSYGGDQMNWLLSANKGGSFNEIKKAASGGELSRIILAMKSILARHSQLPTIIFDEIDTGVSGDIAQKMGVIMQKMSKDMQVLSITHLPQIAAKGDQHFKVFKEEHNGNTITKIKALTQPERVEELAAMLGSSSDASSAMAHAKALLE